MARLSTFLNSPTRSYSRKLSTNEAEHISSNVFMWKALLSLYYINNLPAFSLEFLRKCINADEVFVREKAAFIICSRSNFQFMDDDIIAKLFVDEHPNVIFQAIKGLFISYPSFDKEYKSITSRLISSSFNDPMLVIRSYRLMMTFGIDYGHESLNWRRIEHENHKAMWNLWGEVFSVFLMKCPQYAPPITTGRFSNTLDQAIKYLNPVKGLDLSESLFRWTIKNMEYRSLDTHELAMLSFLLPITKDDKNIRLTLIKEIFSVRFTGFTTYNLSTSIYYWADLTVLEKEIIASLLTEERLDIQWLHAVCLTQANIPSEIQELILGNSHYFKKSVKSIVNNFPEDLLIKCIKVFCGKPQPLWWYGYHHQNVDVWMPILRYILNTHHPIGLNLCINELVFDGVNGFSSNWKNGQRLWSSLSKKYKDRSILLEALTLATSECSCSILSASKMWKSIIKAYQDSNCEDELLSYIAANIEVLQQTGDKHDLFKFWGKDWIFKKLLPKLVTDDSLMKTIHLFSTDNFSSMPLELAENIYKIYSNIYVRFFFTFDFIDEQLKSDEINPSIKKILLSIPNKIDETGRENLKVLTDKEEEIDNWVFLHDSNF